MKVKQKLTLISVALLYVNLQYIMHDRCCYLIILNIHVTIKFLIEPECKYTTILTIAHII